MSSRPGCLLYNPRNRTQEVGHLDCVPFRRPTRDERKNGTDLTSKHVTPLSPTLRIFVTSHLSVVHLQTKARRGDDFVRVLGGTTFTSVYSTFSS